MRRVRYIAFLVVLMAALASSACMKRNAKGLGTGLTGTGRNVVNVTQTGVTGMQTVDNLMAHFQTITGIDITLSKYAAVKTIWDKYKAFLPVQKQTPAITTSMTTAFIAISGAYCKAFIADELALTTTTDRLVFKTIDANGTALTAAQVSDSVNALALRAWSRAASDAEVAIEVQLLNDLKSYVTTPSNTEMKNELGAICTSVLSSLQSLQM